MNSKPQFKLVWDGWNYEFDCNIQKKKAAAYNILLDDFKGTVAAVHVNGEYKGQIMWPPYRVDVTDFLKSGKNNIMVEVIGSPRNLFGPRHYYTRYTKLSGPHTFLSNKVNNTQLIPNELYGRVRIIVSI